MVRLPEDRRVLQIPRESPIRYIVTKMVKGQEPPQPALKILERLLLQPIRISMEESKSEETVRGSSLHE